MNGTHASLSDWPALYNPALELWHIQHQPAVQPRGRYLHDPHDIFIYTFYWTLIFYAPPFLAAAAYAFLNLTFPPARRMRHVLHKRHHGHEQHPAQHVHEGEPMLALVPPRGGIRPPRAIRQNEGRSRLTFALLVVLVYLVCSLAGAVLSSVIGGYVLVGLYAAGRYNMSTWVPLVYALIQSLVGMLGLWSSVIDII